MLKGSFKHEDFCGHRGTITPVDLQWMTAGRGIVHAEMPASQGENIGLQLWINLSRKDKMVEPQYQELLESEIPHVSREGPCRCHRWKLLRSQRKWENVVGETFCYLK